MKTAKLFLINGLIALCVPAICSAVTPKLNNATISSPSTTVDLIPSTNGSGKLLALQCTNTSTIRLQEVDITLDGSTKTIYVDPNYLPIDANSNSFSGWIPLELSFSTSVHVTLVRGSSPAATWDTHCSISWNQ